MSEASLSALELAFLAETLELVREEFEGIMIDTTNEYVLTTGADVMVDQSTEIIMETLYRLRDDNLKEEPADGRKEA